MLASILRLYRRTNLVSTILVPSGMSYFGEHLVLKQLILFLDPSLCPLCCFWRCVSLLIAQVVWVVQTAKIAPEELKDAGKGATAPQPSPRSRTEHEQNPNPG